MPKQFMPDTKASRMPKRLLDSKSCSTSLEMLYTCTSCHKATLSVDWKFNCNEVECEFLERVIVFIIFDDMNV